MEEYPAALTAVMGLACPSVAAPVMGRTPMEEGGTTGPLPLPGMPGTRAAVGGGRLP